MFQGIFKSAINDANKNYIFGTGSIPIQIKTAQLATFADGTTKQQGYQVAEVSKLISTMLTGWDANGNKPKSMSDNYLELILSCDNGFVVKKRLQFPHIIAWQNDSTPYNIADVYKEFSIDNWLKADDFENPDITLVVEPTDEILTTSTATPPEATTTNSGRFYLYYRNLPVGVNRIHIDFHIKTKTEPIDFDLEIVDGLSWEDAQTILASDEQAKINVLLSTAKDVYKYTGAEGNFDEITMHELSALYQQIISLNPNNKFTHDLYFYLYEESELNTKLTELEEDVSQLGQYLYKRYNAKNIRNNSWQHKTTGEITENPNFFIVEGIPVIGFENIKIAQTVGRSDNAMGIVFYDSNDEILSGYSTTSEVNVVVPDGAVYANLTVKKNIYNSTEQLLFQPYPNFSSRDLDKKIAEIDRPEFDINSNPISGEYIRAIDGVAVSHSDYKRTDYIELFKSSFLFKLNFGLNLTTIVAIAFYDKNKDFVFSIGGQTSSSLSYVEQEVDFSEHPNVRYFRASLYGSNLYAHCKKVNSININIEDEAITTSNIEDGAVTEQKTIFFEHDPNSNFIDRNKLTPGYYIDADGIPRSTKSPNYFITDKVFLVEGETYFKGNLFGGYCAFYQEDGTLVQGYGATNSFLSNPFVVPQGAVYGRFTLNTAGADQTCWISNNNIAPVDYKLVIKRSLIPKDVEITPKNYSGRDISTFAKIMCIGDSLTEGAFNYLSGGSFSNGTNAAALGRPYSYPQYLAKLTGCDVINLGKSGYTSSQWYDYYTTGEGADTDFSGYDCAIIQLGVNDNADTLDTVTKTALDNIINKIKTANAGIKIFFAGIINAKSYPAATEGENYYAKDQWLRNYYNTYYANDAQVFFVDHVAYGHLRDLLNAQHGGSYPVDNYNEGHLSAYGYLRLAQDYVSIISYIMSHNNAQNFRDIQFIGTNYQCY